MKRYQALLGAVAILLCIVAALTVFWPLRSEQRISGSEALRHKDAATSGVAHIAREQFSGTRTSEAAVSSKPGSSPISRQVNETEFEPRIEIGDPRLLPATAEEVQWYERNGFPSSATVQVALSSYMDAARFDRSTPRTPGNLIRAEQFAIMHPERASGSLDFLYHSAAHGSIYALEALWRVYGSRANRMGNPTLSEAYALAAEARGNWPLALSRLGYGDANTSFARLHAIQILADLNRYRISLGLPPLSVDPFPGLEEFIQRQNDGRPKQASGH